jgi:hypothetical protein
VTDPQAAGVALPPAAREASGRWSQQLGLWAIPEALLAAAPESPWGFSPGLFALSAQRALDYPRPSPSRRRATEALPWRGVVLDVGAGGGAASLPLVPPAGTLVAVDESEDMLGVFAEAAERLGAAHTEIVGHWPDVADQAPHAAVVVCRHVVYNVGDLAPFLAALNGHAERRVVIELTDRHPQSDLSPLWKAIHGIDRPTGPTAADAVGVAAALGYDVHVERFDEPSLWHEWPRDERLAFARRRLCLGPGHDAQIGAYLDRTEDLPRQVVTLWWDCRS